MTELLLCVRCPFGEERHPVIKMDAISWYTAQLDGSLVSLDRELSSIRYYILQYPFVRP